MSDPGRGHHDMGGLEASAVARVEHDYALWEKRVDALLVLLSDRKRNLVKTDELRRGIEQLGVKAYDDMTYYERWIASITDVLIGKGVITSEELGRQMAEVEQRSTREGGT